MSAAAAAEFWEFSLARYAEPGVAEAALRLQDDFGCDVNLLLLCLWAAACGRALEPADFAALDAAAAPWRSAIVEPLRQVRRTLKTQPFADARSQPIRQRLLDLEIECERIVQERIAGALPPAPVAAGAPSARRNLEGYLRWRGVDQELAGSLVTALVSG